VGHVFDPQIDIPLACPKTCALYPHAGIQSPERAGGIAHWCYQKWWMCFVRALDSDRRDAVLETNLKKPPPGPLNGVRGTLLAGFCLLAGAFILAYDGPWYAWAILFLIAILLAIRS